MSNKKYKKVRYTLGLVAHTTKRNKKSIIFLKCHEANKNIVKNVVKRKNKWKSKEFLKTGKR